MWVVDGWTATEFIEGLTSLQGDSARVIRTGEQLCDALAGVALGDSAPVTSRVDRWAKADRCAWGEERMELDAEAEDLCSTLWDHTSANEDSNVIVHADLTGNVFEDPEGCAVCLDFSPFIRPKRYGSAIVVADHLLWHGGEVGLIELIDGDEDGLARALLFRLITDELGVPPEENHRQRYRTVIEALGWA